MNSLQHFGVVGGGAWGTALAQVLVRAGRDVTLWAREPEVVSALNDQHENTIFLPGLALEKNIRATGNLADLASCDVWVLVTPTQYVRHLSQQLAALGSTKRQPVISAAKGIEQNTLALPGDVIAQILSSHPLAILSGPTFAQEVAQGQPTALTLACLNPELGQQLTQAISSRSFRPYLSDDVIGAQIGGAIKNVLAVACGIATGAGMGDNTRAALITRGLAEMMRLGAVLGGQAETLMGLSGLGDLVLTCSSEQSRNMSLGMALGQGMPLQKILEGKKSVAEGVFTAAAAAALAYKHGLDMPIVTAVDAVLNQGANVSDVIEALLSRPLKDERN